MAGCIWAGAFWGPMSTSAPVATAGTFAALLARRGNSFGFVRFALACLVILSHSWTLGGHGSEALAPETKETLGRLAVYGFFVLSGFLIAHSYSSTGSVVRFFWHRVLRIVPGYYACLLVTAAVFASVQRYVETGSLVGHWQDVGAFLYANKTLRVHSWQVGNTLAEHPYGYIWIGALWTLIYEFKCYILAGVLGVTGILRRAPALVLVGYIGTLIALAVEIAHEGAVQKLMPGWIWIDPPMIEFVPCFLAGMVAWLYRDRIRTMGWLATALLAVAVAVLMGWPKWFTLAAVVTLPYLTLYLAARLPFREFERRGDLSYGIYLYGFPVQQLLVTAGAASLDPVLFALLAVVATVPLAAASWFWVERPILRLKNIKLPTAWLALAWRRRRA